MNITSIMPENRALRLSVAVCKVLVRTRGSGTSGTRQWGGVAAGNERTLTAKDAPRGEGDPPRDDLDGQHTDEQATIASTGPLNRAPLRPRPGRACGAPFGR